VRHSESLENSRALRLVGQHSRAPAFSKHALKAFRGKA
jgi:hypothetical protein